MKVVTWDAANGRYKEIVTGRVITAANLPPDLADGDIWIDTSDPADPVTWAKVSGVVYEVVGSGWLEEIPGNHVMEIHGGPMDDYPVTDTVTYPTTTETPTVNGTLAAQLATTITGLSPVGYWRLSDAASPPQDSSGNARHASATTSVTYRNTAGGGAAVDAVSSYPTLVAASHIPVADNNVWTPGASGLTIFFLTRPTSLLASRAFVFKGAASNYEWQIEQAATGRIQMSLFNASGSTALRSTASPDNTVVTNIWQAFCITVSGNTDAANIELYKNSNVALTKAANSSAGAGTVTNGTGVLSLGDRPDFNTFAQVGSMAHIAIFTGVLSGANIQSIMDAARNDGWIV